MAGDAVILLALLQVDDALVAESFVYEIIFAELV
jgi:hypothetical protein